jgi:hypothetical protein
MKRALLVALVAATLGSSPGHAQTTYPAPADEPIPVAADAPAGSSSAGAHASGSVASGGLMLVGLLALVVIGAGVAIANSN